MSNRDRIITSTTAKLVAEGVAFSSHDAELVEQTTLRGSVATGSGDRSVVLVVTRFPKGENLETYAGAEGWTVDVLNGEDEEPLDRPQNPVDSLELALSMIDWDRVRSAIQNDK